MVVKLGKEFAFSEVHDQKSLFLMQVLKLLVLFPRESFEDVKVFR